MSKQAKASKPKPKPEPTRNSGNYFKPTGSTPKSKKN